MKKILKIDKNRLDEIINQSIATVVSESKELDNTTYQGHKLEVVKYDMTNPEDAQFVKENKELIWDILQKGYENLDGFKGFQSKRDMLKKSPFFTMGFYDEEIVAVTVYNTYLGGNKCVGATCVKDDRHEGGVKLLEMIMSYNIKNWDEWIWLEASGKVEEMCKKLNGFNVPSEYAVIYLQNKNFSITDEYHYVRMIRGQEEQKTIYGFKDKNSFDVLSNHLNKQVKAFLDRLNKQDISESEEYDNRDKIWMEYSQNMSDIEKAITIINYFVYLKDDELINEFPLDAYNILKQTVKTAEELLKINDYTQNEIFRYKNCIDDGYRVLNTSTVLSPLSLSA